MPRENCGEKSYCENTYIFKLQLPIDTFSLAVLLKSEEHLVKEPKLKVNIPRVEEPDYFLISYRRFFINFIHFRTIRVTIKKLLNLHEVGPALFRLLQCGARREHINNLGHLKSFSL